MELIYKGEGKELIKLIGFFDKIINVYIPNELINKKDSEKEVFILIDKCLIFENVWKKHGYDYLLGVYDSERTHFRFLPTEYKESYFEVVK